MHGLRSGGVRAGHASRAAMGLAGVKVGVDPGVAWDWGLSSRF